MAGQFEVKQSDNGQFMFNLNAPNGQVILTSELYQAKASAKKGIESVRKHAADDAHFERRTSSGGKPYFVLKAANHQIVGTSEIYSSVTVMDKGIVSVKANAPSAPVVDLTT